MTSPYLRSAIGHLTKLAERGDLAAARELLRRAIIHCDQSADARDSALAEWVKEFLRGAIENPRHTVSQLIAREETPLRRNRTGRSSLNQEIYLRVRDGLDTGTPRKRVFSDVARQLNLLGYRNAKNEPLRAMSIERQYYAVRRKIDS